ncbi:MAG: alpha-galactosidase [Eubacterium sp.]|nr:alpha-galactosidase [Eubacterium sp.]
MAVIINRKKNIFVLDTKSRHYVIGVDEYGCVHNIHWGRKCPIEDYETPFSHDVGHNHRMKDCFREEYTGFGGTVYKECAIKALFSDACRELDLKYKDFKAEDNSLEITLNDTYYPLEITLRYEIFDGFDIIKKSAAVKNLGEDSIIFEKLMSGEINLPDIKPYNIINTLGNWGAEYGEVNTPLKGGSLVFESRRGTSGHSNSPNFIAYQNADEKSGDVFFANLVWSGSFKVEISRDVRGITRALLGINPIDFEYTLEGHSEFCAPEIIFGMTEGFGEMSRQLGDYGIKHHLPREFAEVPLPVLYNSWEATEFDVSTKEQTALAQKAAKAGCELFVMDDGWFGERKDDHAGLGDWFVNKEKFPNGIDELIGNVNSLGMDFGLWFEPEMVNPDSDLFRAHPDWAYHYDTRCAHEIRNQLVLNMTRKDVQEYIFERMDTLLSEHNIKYIKWDMNRSLSETGAQNLNNAKMLWLLHTKAVYDIVDRLRKKHPDVQFESCSSGGGRADWGALKHFDMVWTSDNTDSIDRIVIQKNYAMTRPVKTMRAWVTDINWYNRNAPLEFRFNIAMRGALSLGGNLKNYTDDEIEICRKNVELYKDIRPLVQFGSLYRLLDIDRDEVSADLYLDSDKNNAVLFIAAVNTRCMKEPEILRFDGLDDEKIYEFDFDSAHYEKSGAYLKNVGISLDVKKQYYNKIIKIKSK